MHLSYNSIRFACKGTKFIPFLQKKSSFTCVFQKKAVLLHSRLVILVHTKLYNAIQCCTALHDALAIVAQLVEQRIRNAWVGGLITQIAGLEAEN